MLYTIQVNGRLDGLNEYTKANRTNKYAGATMKKKNEEQVLSAVRAAGLEGKGINEPVRLIIDWYEPNRRRDLDNIAFAKKFILDGLVKAGLIINDSWDYVKGFIDYFYIDKQNPRIVIFIETLSDSSTATTCESSREE